MAMRNAKIPVQCEICGKTVIKKGLNKHIDMAHGEGQKYAFSSVSHSSNLENGFQKGVNEIEAISERVEKREENPMGDCPNCTAREIEMQRLRTEVIPGLKAESEQSERQVKELNEQVTLLTKQLAEKQEPVAQTVIPENIEEVIVHCESGTCRAHTHQWEGIKRRIVEANKSSIVEATLNNLPDVVVESEALKRGFIPKRITIPMSIIARR